MGRKLQMLLLVQASKEHVPRGCVPGTVVVVPDEAVMEAWAGQISQHLEEGALNWCQFKAGSFVCSTGKVRDACGAVAASSYQHQPCRTCCQACLLNIV